MTSLKRPRVLLNSGWCGVVVFVAHNTALHLVNISTMPCALCKA